jgi:hypothetical protein
VGDGTREIAGLHFHNQGVAIKAYVTGEASKVALLLVNHGGRFRVVMAGEEATHFRSVGTHVGYLAAVVFNYGLDVQPRKLW